MDRKLRKILTECIREIESGDSNMEGCLQRYPDRAAELRSHLELWSGLDAAAKAQPNFGSQQRGQHQMLAALADMERRGGERRMIPTLLAPVAAKAVAVVAAAALLGGGAAGASAALGGPNVADEVLTAVGLENADEEAEFGLDTAQDAVDDGVDGLDIAEDRAAGEADEGLSTAEDAVDDVPDGEDVPGDVPPEDVPPEDVPPEDVPPEDVPPEDVPPEDAP